MAVLSWQEDGRQRRIRRSTGVRCYPDKTDADGKVVKQDNRGKGAAEDFLRKWRDELIAQEVVEPETPAATPRSTTTRRSTSTCYT